MEEPLPINQSPDKQAVFNKRYVFLIVLVLYGLSLVLPAAFLGDSYEQEFVKGWEILWIGWMAIFGGCIAWYANIGLIVTLIAYGVDLNKGGFRCAVVSFLIALSSFLYIKKPVLNDIFTSMFDYYVVGFYCWLMVFVVLMVVMYVESRKH